MRTVEVQLHHLTGDAFDSEIEWSIRARVELGKSSVDFDAVVGRLTDGTGLAMGPMPFEEWLEVFELDLYVTEKLEAQAIEKAAAGVNAAQKDFLL